MFYKRKDGEIVEVLEVKSITDYNGRDREMRNVVQLRTVRTGIEYTEWKGIFLERYVHIPEEDVELAILASV